MTRRLFPRRFPTAAPFVLAAAASLSLTPLAAVMVRAQDPAPGTLDDTFAIDRVRNPTFLPSQSNFTPFAIALQPGQDPVQPANPNRREIPAAQTKLLIGGDAATLFRVFLTPTVIATTTYYNGTDTAIPVGTPVTGYSAPFQPGDFDQVFFTAPAASNGIGNSGRITYALSVNADGGVLVGGLFGRTSLVGSIFDTNQEKNVVLLNFNGDPEITNTLDADGIVLSQSQGPFNTNLAAGANDAVLAILRRSTVVPGESAGRLLLGGQFIRFNRQDRGRIVQLLPDGTQDADFNANLGSGANGIVFSLAEVIDPNTGVANGQIYVCGDFDSFNGNGPGKLVRLNADGTRDATFTPNIQGRAIAVAAQPDGKVLVGGDLDSIGGTAVNNLARLNADGTLDAVFLANAAVNLSFPNNIPPTSVYVLRVQADGRILVGGNYLQLDGTTRRYLGRLNADGTLDTTFNADGFLSDPANTNVTGIISNAVQSVVTVPRDPSLGVGTDLIYSQTRADRKQVSGDTGFFPNPVRRLFGDNNATAAVATVPAGAPLVRIGADGPTATVGDLSTRLDLAGLAVSNPGTPGLFRITREGDVSNDLSVRLKVGAAAAADLNVTYDIRQLIFTSTPTTSASGTTTNVITTTASDRFPGSSFNVVIPAGSSSVSLLVEGLADGQTQLNGERVKLKVQVSTDGAYGLRADQRAAVVTVLPNNL